MAFETEQEVFWAGEFGNAYIDRNRPVDWVASNTAFFARILDRCRGLNSVIEFGANIGLNMKALRTLYPSAELAGIEINTEAAATLRSIEGVEVFHESILDFDREQTWDLTFTKGVLIHINPDRLSDVYERLYRHSNRYILVAEYYNPSPMEIPYRGHVGKLFKRDFCAEIMERFDDLELVDYGFVYHRDPNFKQDDLTWFLMRKTRP
jgi:pseudaminic acid biosynthesis-associated methylase